MQGTASASVGIRDEPESYQSRLATRTTDEAVRRSVHDEVCDEVCDRANASKFLIFLLIRALVAVPRGWIRGETEKKRRRAGYRLPPHSRRCRRGASNLECGGKRSATPLFPCQKQCQELKKKLQLDAFALTCATKTGDDVSGQRSINTSSLHFVPHIVVYALSHTSSFTLRPTRRRLRFVDSFIPRAQAGPRRRAQRTRRWRLRLRGEAPSLPRPRVNGYESAMPLPLSRPKKCQVIFPKNG